MSNIRRRAVPTTSRPDAKDVLFRREFKTRNTRAEHKASGAVPVADIRPIGSAGTSVLNFKFLRANDFAERLDPAEAWVGFLKPRSVGRAVTSRRTSLKPGGPLRRSPFAARACTFG